MVTIFARYFFSYFQLKVVLDWSSCFQAENVNGSDSRKIEVSGTSTPDVPLELQIINRTTEGFEISWVQAFDGGSPQTFQV